MDRRTWISGITASCAGLLASSSGVAAITDPAWLMEGAWLVSLEGDNRDRFLILSGLVLSAGQLTADKTSYGYIDGSAKPVRQWQALVEGDVIRLKFLTPADSSVEAVFREGETAIVGEFISSRGRRSKLRMTKLPMEELAELRESSKVVGKMSGMSVRAGARIVLLYAGASDCPACMGYEAEFFGRKNQMAVLLPEFSEIVYQKVSLGSYRGVAGLAMVLPQELKPLAMPSLNGERPKLRAHGTPYFAAIIDDKVIAQAHGITGLETLIIPGLRQAVARRRKVS